MGNRKQLQVACEEDLMKAVFKRCGRANEGCLDPRTSDSGMSFLLLGLKEQGEEGGLSEPSESWEQEEGPPDCDHRGT